MFIILGCSPVSLVPVSFFPRPGVPPPSSPVSLNPRCKKSTQIKWSRPLALDPWRPRGGKKKPPRTPAFLAQNQKPRSLFRPGGKQVGVKSPIETDDKSDTLSSLAFEHGKRNIENAIAKKERLFSKLFLSIFNFFVAKELIKMQLIKCTPYTSY